jgi:autoinducer 2-degrading protein
LIKDGEGSLEEEPDTVRFDVIRDSSNPNIIFLYEVYRDEAAFEAHTEGPHYKRVMEVFDEMVTNNLGTIEELGRGLTLFPPDINEAWQRLSS